MDNSNTSAPPTLMGVVNMMLEVNEAFRKFDDYAEKELSKLEEYARTSTASAASKKAHIARVRKPIDMVGELKDTIMPNMKAMQHLLHVMDVRLNTQEEFIRSLKRMYEDEFKKSILQDIKLDK